MTVDLPFIHNNKSWPIDCIDCIVYQWLAKPAARYRIFGFDPFPYTEILYYPLVN